MSCDGHVLPLSPRIREAFGSEQWFQVLLRPDNHVALISRDVSPQRIEAYFEKLNALKVL